MQIFDLLSLEWPLNTGKSDYGVELVGETFWSSRRVNAVTLRFPDCLAFVLDPFGWDFRVVIWTAASGWIWAKREIMQSHDHRAQSSCHKGCAHVFLFLIRQVIPWMLSNSQAFYHDDTLRVLLHLRWQNGRCKQKDGRNLYLFLFLALFNGIQGVCTPRFPFKRAARPDKSPHFTVSGHEQVSRHPPEGKKKIKSAKVPEHNKSRVERSLRT